MTGLKDAVYGLAAGDAPGVTDDIREHCNPQIRFEPDGKGGFVFHDPERTGNGEKTDIHIVPADGNVSRAVWMTDRLLSDGALIECSCSDFIGDRYIFDMTEIHEEDGRLAEESSERVDGLCRKLAAGCHPGNNIIILLSGEIPSLRTANDIMGRVYGIFGMDGQVIFSVHPVEGTGYWFSIWMQERHI